MSSKKRTNSNPGGGNRQQRRDNSYTPYKKSAGKPMWLRVLIIVMLGVMLIGFFLVPLLR